MEYPNIAILHYTAPPVVGGVEAVILAHAQIFTRTGYPTTVVAGWGEAAALPEGSSFVRVPEMDSQFDQVAEMGVQLEQGIVPGGFEVMANQLMSALAAILDGFDTVIVHNVFTKHFNLPLTVALSQLLEAGVIQNGIAWCHDFSWTSPSSGTKVHPGYPWELLRSQRCDLTYVVVSQRRQAELAGLYGCPPEQIRVVYNGVDAESLLGLSPEGKALVDRLGLMQRDMVILMPVRVTQAKNIEYALRVVASLKTRGCRPKLVVTGPPDPHDADSMAYYESLRSLRQQLEVEDEVRFVFESGPDPTQSFVIDVGAVGELFRVSDVMLMPSHREGFGMPVLEAGLVGIPVVATDVPAAVEVGGGDVMQFDQSTTPEQLAAGILSWAENSQVHRFRRRVRKRLTWQAIFERDIEPLLRKRVTA
jgi:glycosyltransferase involved in cell wall biosynthesis